MTESDEIWMRVRGFVAEQRNPHIGPTWSLRCAGGLAFHAREPILPRARVGLDVGVSLGGAMSYQTGFGNDAESAFHDLFTALIDDGDLAAANELNAIMYPDDAEACHA